MGSSILCVCPAEVTFNYLDSSSASSSTAHILRPPQHRFIVWVPSHEYYDTSRKYRATPSSLGREECHNPPPRHFLIIT